MPASRPWTGFLRRRFSATSATTPATRAPGHLLGDGCRRFGHCGGLHGRFWGCESNPSFRQRRHRHHQ
jgi:hypothetical protein